MFGSFGNLFDNFDNILKLAQDKDFQKFFQNPRVQFLMKDPEFKRAVEEKNIFSLMSHREFQEAMKDPEVLAALGDMQRKFAKNPDFFGSRSCIL